MGLAWALSGAGDLAGDQEEALGQKGLDEVSALVAETDDRGGGNTRVRRALD